MRRGPSRATAGLTAHGQHPTCLTGTVNNIVEVESSQCLCNKTVDPPPHRDRRHFRFEQFKVLLNLST